MGVVNVWHIVTVLIVTSLLTQATSPDFFGQKSVLDSTKDMLDTFATFNDAWGSLLDPFSSSSEEGEHSDDGKNPFEMPDYWNLFRVRGGPGPWWKGPNVCVEREEIDESQHKNETDVDDMFSNFHFSSCQQTEIKYVCRTKVRSHGVHKTYIVKYQCCHGFKRVPGKPGCTEAHLKSLMETLSDVGAKDYIELVRTSGLEEKLSADNLTVFAPSDDAIRDFTDSVQEANQVEFYIPPASTRRRRSPSMENASMRDVVLGHITEGFHDISELVNEQVLTSDNNNSSIRVNIYPMLGDRIITANCARVTSVNNYATNGIIHVVDRVIQPVTKTLAELISEDDQFATFKSMLGKADLLKLLSEPGHITLFAPTDSAFDKLDQNVRNRLMQAESCVSNVINHHVAPHVVCSAAVQARAITHNMAGNSLIIERHPEDGKLFVNDVQIVAKDILGTNGVIHVVDDVLMPDSGRPVSGVLSAHNLTKFVSLLNEAGLTDSVDGMNNVTLFAPTDEALSTEEAVAEIERVRADKDRLRDLLLYHTTGPQVESCGFSNNQELKTGVADKSLRINLYSALPFFTGAINKATVECARIVNLDNQACGGVVHEVDRLLVPPSLTIEEKLEKMANFSILSNLIKNAGLEAEFKENAPVTLVAPTDEAFHKLSESDLTKLQEDKELAAKVLKQHILPEMLCCSGVSVTSWPFVNRVETLGGHSVNVRRDHEDHIHIGSTTVHECDIMTTNGVIHSVNRVMMPSSHSGSRLRWHQLTNPNVDIFLAGL